MVVGDSGPADNCRVLAVEPRGGGFPDGAAVPEGPEDRAAGPEALDIEVSLCTGAGELLPVRVRAAVGGATSGAPVLAHGALLRDISRIPWLAAIRFQWQRRS